MALAPLGLPIYVLLHIIECLPGFSDCIDTFTAYQRVARIQTIVNLAKHAVYRSTIACTSKVLKL